MLISVSEVREVLALVAYRLGFTPQDSLVAVGVNGTGPRHRVGLVARVDLTAVHDSAALLCGHLVASDAAAALLVAYTDDPARAHTAAATMREALATFAVDAGASVWVTSTTYRTIDPDQPWLHEEPGAPLSDLDSTIVAASMVTLGQAVAPDRAALAPAPAPAPARETAAGARAAQGVPATAGERTQALAAWRQAATGDSADPALLGILAAGLDDAAVRDAVMCEAVPDGAAGADALVAGTHATVLTRILASVIDPAQGVQPGEEAERTRALLVQVAAHVDSAPADTLLGLLAWWHGDGARANVLIDRALTTTPDYRLALLLRQALAAGMPPAWLRRPR